MNMLTTRTTPAPGISSFNLSNNQHLSFIILTTIGQKEIHHSPRHAHDKSPQLDPRYTVLVDVIDDSIEALPIEEHI